MDIEQWLRQLIFDPDPRFRRGFIPGGHPRSGLAVSAVDDGTVTIGRRGFYPTPDDVVEIDRLLHVVLPDHILDRGKPFSKDGYGCVRWEFTPVKELVKKIHHLDPKMRDRVMIALQRSKQ